MKQLFSITLLILIFFTARAQSDSATRAKALDSVLPTKKALTAVTVTALKPFIIQKTDKITLNVAASPLAAGGTAYDALLRAPGIADNKSLSFRGRSVLVLIDGKPTNLSGDDLKNYLDAMPAGTVDKIEILPNPPARYDAKGETVIDIRTTRSKNLGASGSLTAGAGAGLYGRYNGGASLQYRAKGLSLYGSYDYQHNTTFYDQRSERSLSATTGLFSNSRNLRTRNNHSLTLGLDYDLSGKTTIGFLIRGADNASNRTVWLNNRLSHTNAQPDTLSTVQTLGSARFRTPAVNVYFRTKLDTAGAELSISADYFRYNKQWSDHFTTTHQDAKGTEYTTPTYLQDQSPAENSVRSLSADLTRPGKFAQWQAGLKATTTRTDNDVRWLQDNTLDTGKTNHFIYQENVYAAYASATKSIRKLDLNLGLRLEHTRTSGYSVTLDQLNKRQYTQLFPTITATYNLSGKQQLGFSYRKSTLRPDFDVLNPFIIYQSQYAYSRGNPYARASVTHRYELSYSYNNEWLGALSYGRYVDPIASSIRKLGDSGAIVSTTDNLTSADMIGLDITWTKRLLKGHWTTATTLGSYYLRFHSVKDHTLDKQMFSTYLSSDNMFMLSKSLKGQLNASWYGPQMDGAYHFQSMFTLGLGLTKTILHNNGTLAFNVSDVFNSYKARYRTVSDGLLITNTDHPESRFVKLVFTWRFGNKNVKTTRARSTGIDEVKNRMGN